MKIHINNFYCHLKIHFGDARVSFAAHQAKFTTVNEIIYTNTYNEIHANKAYKTDISTQELKSNGHYCKKSLSTLKFLSNSQLKIVLEKSCSHIY